ncbi:hypothetical protein BDM02DRAFT_3135161 [Thelephora ganbajun]|uniref:Uncharacterized protein n=1 Tax=Thelephora ganbajun TaxID=370292 RepID=A0ACB6ZWI5_THEGA|nr:hypothetical protein BDM02DRAFT_3135161 [Thelephora ganbajun]
MSLRPPIKKPTGSRPLRTASVDSTASTKSQHSINTLPGILRKSSKPTALGHEGIDEAREDSKPFYGVSLVDSPIGEDPPKDRSNEPQYLDIVSPHPEHSDGSAELPSPSRARWELIRRHVIHNSLPSVTSSLAPSLQSVPKPLASPSPTGGWPGAPKPSRFPRLGMRQVVDAAREVAMEDTRKFALELERACVQFRAPEIIHNRPMREGSAARSALSFSLPHPTGAVSTISSTNWSKQPTGSIITPPQSPVLTLLRILERYEASLLYLPRTLPFENQVLSVLLVPFMAPDPSEREQDYALRAFSLIIKTWRTDLPEAELNRCLWCCSSAARPSQYRAEIIGAMSTLLFSRDATFRTETPVLLQTILQALVSLLPTLSSSPGELESVKGLILEVWNGGGGLLLKESIEKEFGTPFSTSDTEHDIREALAVESVLRCIAYGSLKTRAWVLHNLVEEYWSVPSSAETLSSLSTKAHSRKICTFGHAANQLLEVNGLDHCATVLHIVETLVLPEVARLGMVKENETMRLVVLLVIQVLCLETGEGRLTRSAHLLTQWVRNSSSWKFELEGALGYLIENDELPKIARVFSSLGLLPGDVQKSVMTAWFPKLCDRLTAESITTPDPSITELLLSTAKRYPQIFFKPLFLCAASNKELITASYLRTLVTLLTYLPNILTSNAEMMSVALMGNLSNTGSVDEASNLTWEQARLGHCVVMVELISCLRSLRKSADAAPGLVAFINSLESRLAVLLEAKERSTLVPFSQRALYCILFYEMRLTTHSLKPSTWVSRILQWVTQWHEGYEGGHSFKGEVELMVSKLLALYSATELGSRSNAKSRGTMVLSTFPVVETPSTGNEPSTLMSDRKQLLWSFSNRFEAVSYPLLVLVCGLLSVKDYAALCPLLWSDSLTDPDPKVLAPTCFLAMQCAEKCGGEFIKYITNDMSSDDPVSRHSAIDKVAKLISWRFQISSQTVILDKTFRRPFKMTRPSISFVPTDIGSSQHIQEKGEATKNNKNTLPLELRKRLMEIGWDDEEGPLDQRLEWATTPMSLIPSIDLTKVDNDDTLSAEIQRLAFEAISKKLIEREASVTTISTTDTTVKRRPILVTSLLSIFPRIFSLALDPDLVVANAARNLLLELMRDDPASLSRPILSAMTGGGNEMSSAISTLRELTHISHRLPPATTHHVFTHLTGYLKFAARQMETIDALHGFAYTVPILAKLVSRVNGMVMKEVRKAKLEVFLVPNLSLWFPPTAPISPMFPQSLGGMRDPFTVDPKLRWITMIRAAQNTLFVSMLKKNPQDVHAIRKNLEGFSLPGDDQSGPINLVDFIPCQTDNRRGEIRNPVVDGLSLVLSRSYLLLVAQVFRSMSRHTNDREEFVLLVDGINRILLTHGDDLGIVAQAMIALMIASTRFRRLFMSTGGYTLFMPAVFKSYSQSTKGSAIRLAIEYGINRFYLQHEEAFVFQTLDILSLIIFRKECTDHCKVAEDAFSLLSTLRNAAPQNAPDPAGIHDTNKIHEYESLLVSKAEVEPHDFMEKMRSTKGEAIEVPVTDEPVGRGFSDDDMARLFLTVIAHNPDIHRAQQFLTMFRYFAPHIWAVSKEARTVVTEGTEALGSILLSKVGKVKLPDSIQSRSEKELDLENFDRPMDSGASRVSQPNSPSDILAMRLEYLSLVEGLAQVGAHLRPAGFLRVWELVKVIFKEARVASVQIANFVAKWTEASLLRNAMISSPRFILTFLQELTPVLRTMIQITDLSPVLRTVARLAQDPLHSKDSAFMHAVTSISSTALDAFSTIIENSDAVPQEMQTSILELLKACIGVAGEDALSQLERRNPSHEFLSGIVLPFVLSLKTSAQAMAENDPAHSMNRRTYPHVWVRVLAYAVSACKGNIKGPPASQGEKGTEDNREERLVLRMAVGLQIIKVVAIRAGDDVTSILPDVWSRTGIFLREALKGGNAAFALVLGDYSQPSSPLQSPSVSLQTSMAVDQMDALAFPPRKVNHIARPRVLDYMTWSLFEVLCVYRTQLLLEMRPMMQEKVRILEDQLGMERLASRPTTGQSSSRPTSGLFSKRGRFPKYQSMTTPNQSPRDRTTSLTLVNPGESNMAIRGRDPGYLYSSPSSASPVAGLPHIVHLGPARHTAMFGTSESEGGGAIRLSQSIVIKSGPLTQAVFRKVRLVQTYLGYSRLLPNPDPISVDDDPVDVSGWTKAQILQSIIDETKILVDEFGKRANGKEDFEFDDVGDNTVVVEPENPFTSAA